MNPSVTVSDHPLMLHKLTLLRDVNTAPPAFRQLVREMAQMLFMEATRTLPLTEMQVQTPMAPCLGWKIASPPGLVPILRAGLGMAEAIQDLVPEIPVWHLGLYRDHVTHQPVTYYQKLPAKPTIEICFLVDPMLATGGSAIAAVDILKQWGLKKIILLSLIAAPEGVKALTSAHPDVPIHLAALDSHLDANMYIVPGLGDAGDRQFGTEG